MEKIKIEYNKEETFTFKEACQLAISGKTMFCAKAKLKLIWNKRGLMVIDEDNQTHITNAYTFENSYWIIEVKEQKELYAHEIIDELNDKHKKPTWHFNMYGSHHTCCMFKRINRTSEVKLDVLNRIEETNYKLKSYTEYNEFTKLEKDALSKLLDLAGDEFSNHGCNDLASDFFDGWSEQEKKDFAKKVLIDQWGEEEVEDSDFISMYGSLRDDLLMNYFSDRLKTKEEEK